MTEKTSVKMESKYVVKTCPEYRAFIASANRSRIPKGDISEDLWKEVVTRPCAYCGAKGDVTLGRISLKSGFLKKNCEAICWTCAEKKAEWPRAAFVKWIRSVYEYCCEEDIRVADQVGGARTRGKKAIEEALSVGFNLGDSSIIAAAKTARKKVKEQKIDENGIYDLSDFEDEDELRGTVKGGL